MEDETEQQLVENPKIDKTSMYYFNFQPEHRPDVTTHPAIDWALKNVLDVAKIRAKKSFMYIAVIAGGPGSGKSTLLRTCCAYCDENFKQAHICYEVHGKGQFLDVSTNCPEGTAIGMDESFKAFNAKGAMTKDFMDLLNHLQLLRQKRIFVFLAIPNWFSMTPAISLNLSSHLFMTKETRLGTRGAFFAWGREDKRRLWVKGKRFMDYRAHKSNFRGRFYSNKDMIIDEVEYDKRKYAHLLEQSKKPQKAPITDRNNIINNLHVIKEWKTDELCEFFHLKPRTITGILQTFNKISENGD